MIERYSRPEMANIWTEENKYRAWLEVEILADEAWAELGEIPKEDVALIREKADFRRGAQTHGSTRPHGHCRHQRRRSHHPFVPATALCALHSRHAVSHRPVSHARSQEAAHSQPRSHRHRRDLDGACRLARQCRRRFAPLSRPHASFRRGATVAHRRFAATFARGQGRRPRIVVALLRFRILLLEPRAAEDTFRHR